MKEILNSLIDQSFEQLVKDTQDLVSINSTLDESTVTADAPFGIGIKKALDLGLQKGANMGMETKNCDGYAGHIQLGNSGKLVAVLAHVDVVPAVGSWICDPYSAQIIDNKLYGRGSVDDKGPALACLYAMKAIKDSGLPFSNHVRLILGTDEETFARGIHYYLEREEHPDCGFSPDAEFPIIHAEKGILRFLYRLPYNDPHPVLQELSAGTRLNVVPDKASALLTMDSSTVQNVIKELQMENQCTAVSQKNGCLLTATGISSHASYPKDGLNAIQSIYQVLARLLDTNHPVDVFIRSIAENLKMETDGKSLGIYCEDAVSGSLTINPAITELKNNELILKFDIRYPVTSDSTMLLKSLENFAQKTGSAYELVQHKLPLYVEKDRPFIQKMQQAYSDFTGESAKLLSIGGGTYCRYVPNTVSYGPVFPGQKELAHQSNEFIDLDDLRKIAKIYAQTIYNLLV